MNSKLYYEAHITIDPVFGARLAKAASLCSDYGFRIADLLMQKRAEDTPERGKLDTFTTGHGKNYEDLEARMLTVILALQDQGFKVRRYKIEDTIIDSKHADSLHLLTPEPPNVS